MYKGKERISEMERERCVCERDEKGMCVCVCLI